MNKFEEFQSMIQGLHRLKDIPFIVCYTDPKDGDLLPINNDDNYTLAISTAHPILRLMIQRKGNMEVSVIVIFSVIDIINMVRYCHVSIISGVY